MVCPGAPTSDGAGTNFKVKVATYYQRVRLWKPTGVGKHIALMTAGLEKQAGGIEHVHCFDDVRAARAKEVADPSRPSTMRVLPLPRKVLELSWLKLGQPNLSLFGSKPDWIYCPAEDFVPSGSAKFAATIHDTRPFETNLPWSESEEDARYRARWQPVLTRIMDRADLVLTVSEFSKSRLIDLFDVDESRITVVGNGVEDLFFQDEAAVRPDRENFLLAVGGLQPRKGDRHLLRIAQLLKEKMPDMRLCVAGRGYRDSELAARAVGNIELLGYISDGELKDYLNRASAFLMMSEYEGFGIPVLEAMAAKCPVVALKKSALPEVTGSAGVLVDSAEEAFEAVVGLMNDGLQNRALVERGFARANDFRWSSCVNRLAQALGLQASTSSLGT